MVSFTIRFQTSFLRVLAFGLVALGCATTLSAQTLTWNANAESNLAGYRVQYGTVSGSPSTTIDVGRVTSRQITGLTAGTTYYFRVVAYNTSGQASTPSAQISYTVPSTPAPTLTSVSPTSGPTAGGTTITLTGTNFVSGATVTVGGAAASSVVFSSSTRLTARTPAGTAGARDVVVRNPNGQTALRTGAFTYTGTTPPPSGSTLTATGVSPLSGPTSGGTTITVSGTGFVSGATISIGGTAATGVTFVSSTRLTARTPAKSAGGYSVVVRNPNGQTANTPVGFTYSGSSTPPPSGTTLTATAVSPLSGSTSGGTTITVSGTGFVSGATISIGGTAATGVTFVSSTRLTARTPAKAAGGYAVVVRNPNGQTANTPVGFTYTGTSTPPPSGTTLTATAVSPSSGPTSGGTAITVTGTGFVSGATVLIGGTPATSVSVASSTRITARTPAKPAGGYSVVVRNPNGQTANTPRGFLYGSSTTSATATLTSSASLAREIASDDAATVETLSATAATVDGAAAIDASAAAVDGAATEPVAEATTDDAPAAAAQESLAVKRYLAEGIESAQMHTRLAIANPDEGGAHVRLTFMKADGATVRRSLDVPARSRVTLELSEVPELAGASFATLIESDREVAVDRRMSLDAAGRVATVASAIDQASPTWYFAEGPTAAPFEQFYLVQNPGDVDAQVEVRYLLADAAEPVVRTHTVAAHSRTTIWVDREAPALASTKVGAEVVSVDGTPIVVERTVYATVDGSAQARSAVTQAGVTSVDPSSEASPAAARWLLAEGAAGGATPSSTGVVVLNRGAATRVTVTLLFEDGPAATQSFQVDGEARFTLPIAEAFPAAQGRAFSVLVEGADSSADLIVSRTATGQTRGARTDAADSVGTRLK